MNPLRLGVFAALLGFCGLGIAQGQTVVWSNLNNATSISSGPSYINRKSTDVAQSFTTGDTATTLGSITVMLDSFTDTGFSFSLKLYTNSGSSLPGTQIETLSSSTGATIGSNTYTSAASTVLAANTTYWWVASVPTSGSSDSAFNMTNAASGDSLDGWTIGNAYRMDAAGRWTSFGDHVFKFKIVATPVPEPATTAALVGLITLGVVACRRRR